MDQYYLIFTYPGQRGWHVYHKEHEIVTYDNKGLTELCKVALALQEDNLIENFEVVKRINSNT